MGYTLWHSHEYILIILENKIKPSLTLLKIVGLGTNDGSNVPVVSNTWMYSIAWHIPMHKNMAIVFVIDITISNVYWSNNHVWIQNDNVYRSTLYEVRHSTEC